MIYWLWLSETALCDRFTIIDNSAENKQASKKFKIEWIPILTFIREIENLIRQFDDQAAQFLDPNFQQNDNLYYWNTVFYLKLTKSPCYFLERNKPERFHQALSEIVAQNLTQELQKEIEQQDNLMHRVSLFLKLDEDSQDSSSAKEKM